MREIVGVVKDFTIGTPRAGGQKPEAWILPYRDPEATDPRIGGMCVVVRTAGDSLALATRVRRELRDLDPNLPVLKIDSIEEQLNDVLARERLIAALAGFFGVLAVLLSCLGLYGVNSYTVEYRTQEIGIRLALGATPATVVRMVLKLSLWLVLAGVAIGVPATLSTTRLIATMFYGITASDPLTIVEAALLMITVAVLAAFLPARRASRVDPMMALRSD
jgi:ABC-type antimicrobial peptide transport system permease subunit